MKFVPFLIVIVIISCTGGSSQNANAPQPESAISVVQTETLPDPLENLGNGDPEIGWEYISSSNRGKCLDCHSVHGEGNLDGWNLDDTALRHDQEWLALFLDNPRNLRPEVATMPPYRGDEKAIIADIVAFLMTLDTPVDRPPFPDIKPDDEPDPYYGGVGGYRGEERIGESGY